MTDFNWIETSLAGNTMLDHATRVFDSDGGDYIFTMSHVAISGNNVQVEFGQGLWVLTQREGDLEWTARHESKMGAVLLLIAARMGLTGTLSASDNDS